MGRYPCAAPCTYTYRQWHPNQRTGTLRQSICGWSGCRTRTPLFPYCAKHADQLLGILLQKSKSSGCGVYAGRHFSPGDVIAPYTGVVVPEKTHIPSPYLMSTSSRKNVIDATLYRAWASMVNHSDTSPNVTAELIRIPPGHHRRRIELADKRVRHVPVGLLCYPFLDQEVWPFMVATKEIQKGEEFLLNYGTEAKYLLKFKHSTTPTFCKSS